MQEDTASETPQCRQSELRQAARTLPSICTWAQISEIQFLYLAGEKRHQTPGFLPVLCLPVYWFFPTQVFLDKGNTTGHVPSWPTPPHAVIMTKEVTLPQRDGESVFFPTFMALMDQPGQSRSRAEESGHGEAKVYAENTMVSCGQDS